MELPTNTGLNPAGCRNDIFPKWERPSPVGYFSVDSDRFYEAGHGNLRYFRYPNPETFPLDLNVGMGTAKRKVGSPFDESIDHLLRFIVDTYSNLIFELDKRSGESSQGRELSPLLPVEFVSWRGLLRLLMCTPFEKKKNWIIHVIRYKGTFYLSQVETEEDKFDRLNESERQRCMTSWGFKFEQYCLTKSPGEPPNTNVPVDECAEFSCVFYTKLGDKHKMLFGAEMDGIKGERPVHLEPYLPLDELEFTELKTSLGNMNQRQIHSFWTYKTRNWWCQAFLVGIDEIIVGCRDDNGFVQNLQFFSVDQLPKRAKIWNPNKCAWFLISFLDCLKSLMWNVDSPQTVWEFKCHSSNNFITYEVFEGPSEKSFLPEYYIEFIENLSKKIETD